MSQAEKEYEIQFYGFTLEDMKAEAEEMVKHEINQFISKLSSSLEKSITSAETMEQFKLKKQKIQEEIFRRAKKNMSKYFTNVDKHLSIPAYVLLPENKIHHLSNPQYTERDVEALTEEFEDKRKVFEENIVLLNEMNKTIEIFTEIEPALNMEVALQENVEEEIQNGIYTSAINENLQNISEIIRNLKTKLNISPYARFSCGKNMSGLPSGIISHTRKVQSLYKRSLRNLESWYDRRHIFRYHACLLRAKFDQNRNIKDMREARDLLEAGEHELWSKQHYQPKKFAGSPGGCAYEREVTPPDWVLDYWHPLEKAQYPEYFARREQRKKEYVEWWEKTYGKPSATEAHH